MNLIPNRQNHTKMGVKAYLCIKKSISTQFSKLYFKLAYIKKSGFSDNVKLPELWIEQEFTQNILCHAKAKHLKNQNPPKHLNPYLLH